MDTQYKKVYIKNDNYVPEDKANDEIEINVEYAYLTIPQEYVCLYHKLLVYLVDFGEDAVKDCKAACEGNNLYIIQCWNMFQSALACYSLGLLDKANFFINYIESQLELIYRGTDKETYGGTGIMSITEDGRLKARVSCLNDTVRFYVDPETGHLYEEYLSKKEFNTVYTKDNNNLDE